MSEAKTNAPCLCGRGECPECGDHGQAELDAVQKERDCLLRALKRIARRHYDGDGETGKSHDLTNDETHDTLVEIITDARDVVAKVRGS